MEVTIMPITKKGKKKAYKTGRKGRRYQNSPVSCLELF